MKGCAIFLSMLLCSFNIYANDDEDKIPDKRPVIKSFTFVFNKGELPEDTAKRKPYEEPCSDFILKRSDVREFFKKAQMITRRDHNIVLDTSHCVVTGTAVLGDGKKVNWTIDRFRRGHIWSDKWPTVYYYCDDCSSDKYYGPCDMQCSMNGGQTPEQEKETTQ